MEKAKSAFQFTVENAKAVKKFVQDYNVDCDLQAYGSIYLVRYDQEMEDLKHEFAMLQQHGLAEEAGIELMGKEQVSKFTHGTRFIGGLYTKTASTLYPAKLVHGIAEQAKKLGAHLYTNTNVTQVISSTDLHQIQTSRGVCFAKKIIYANNAYAADLVPFVKNVIVPTRGQVITTKPLQEWYWKAGILMNDGFEYMIQREDKRVVLGGCRWKAPCKEQPITDDSSIEPNISEGLREYLPENFPDQCGEGVEIEYEWTGIMGFTEDGMPLVGAVPGTHNQYIAAGYTGHGMPIAFLAAKAVAELALEKTPSLLPAAYSPERFLK